MRELGAYASGEDQEPGLPGPPEQRDGDNSPLVTYTRGPDLSGALEGAGGIGGLLARSSGYSAGNWSTHDYYHADANGNVTYLVSSSQALSASYRYDPFGNLISSSGSLAAANVYRFSSKEIMINSGLYYYLYRFYDPNLQRWINRDPIGEVGGRNLYAFVRNKPVRRLDPLGLSGTTTGGGGGACAAAMQALAEASATFGLFPNDPEAFSQLMDAIAAARDACGPNLPPMPPPEPVTEPIKPWPVPVLPNPLKLPQPRCQYSSVRNSVPTSWNSGFPQPDPGIILGTGLGLALAAGFFFAAGLEFGF